jgi:glycosyltransferase involved in cell wall biosynthesis
MRILIVNSFDLSGGAARAASRLHVALLQRGLKSQMLSIKKSSDDYTIICGNSKIEKLKSTLSIYADNLLTKLYKSRSKSLFSPTLLSFNNIVDKINKINPDIVHFHWINAGMIAISEIDKIEAPIVWSLHDMWAFTGGCHYSDKCVRYNVACGNCPILGSNKLNDLSFKIFKRKQKMFSIKKDITIVGLSKWIFELSKNSQLLKFKNHVNLPNPIDTKIFKPHDKKNSRSIWNLSEDKKYILFGAMGATSDQRKGFKELNEALSKMKKSENIELLVFGSTKPQDSTDFGFVTHYLGSLSDDISLVTLYNAADIMVVPSLQENLSNTIMESLSCGTPIVGFNIGGNSDLIEHKKNGYLAYPEDSNDLLKGIEWVLNNKEYNQLCLNSRKKVLKEFDSIIVCKRYLDLYKSILEKKLTAK